MKHDTQRGEWTEGGARYLFVSSDSLMGLFRHLDVRSHEAAMKALRTAVAEHGGRSAARYAEEDQGALLAAVVAKAAELGWGLWEFAPEDGALRLTVRNSPFAAGHGAAARPVCAPIVGMLQSVASLALGAPALAEELQCAASGAAACTFRAWRPR